MVDIEIHNRGAFGSALVRLAGDEHFLSESGAMFRASANVDIDVTTATKGAGGILSGIKRLVGGDHFFFSTYRSTDGHRVEVGLAPALQGEVRVVPIEPGRAWLCAGASYMGSSADLTVDTRFQGFRGMFSGESLFFLHVAGEGQLLVNAFGRITELDVEGEMVVDTGHVVAFEEKLDYKISKAGGSWLSSFVAGEGLVMRFSGHGRILVQSHNPREFGTAIGRLLPPRRN